MKTLSKIQLCLLLLSSLAANAQEENSILKDSIWSYSIYKYPCELPLIDSNSVYLGADVSPITCLDKKTGKLKWMLDVELAIHKKGFLHTIVGDNKGRIYFNGTAKNLYAADKKTGKILWKFDLKFDDDVCTKISLFNDTLFLNPVNPIFIALTTAGKVAWATDLSKFCTGYTMDKSTIFCQLKGGGFCLLSRRNGKLLKFVSETSRGEVFAHPPKYFDNTIVLGNERDSVRGLDKATFKTLWSLNGAIIQCADNEQLYIHNDTLFMKTDPRNGNQLWRIYGDFAWFLQPTVYKSKVYLQTRHRFYIIDNETGEILYECPFNHKSYTKPIVENGIIYLGYAENYVAVQDPTEKK
ncbi:MAG: PQQ-binding-like beta-propeller repeat protein [Bacteroidota bacterium]|nr:PQQ-binding-like beta-propeller repeat protein [Bacteroidota bacterium]